MLTVHAYPKQYVVAYHNGINIALNPGTTEGQTIKSGMPDYSGSNGGYPAYVDTNSGNRYAVAAGDGSYSGGDASDSITVYSGTTPSIQQAAGEREIRFLGWVLTDADGIPYQWNNTDTSDPGITIADTATVAEATSSSQYPIIEPADLLELRNIMDAASSYGTTGTEYALYLTALWNEPAKPYKYFVTFNYTDPEGHEHTRVDATVTRTTTSGTEGDTDTATKLAEGDGHTFAATDDQYYVAMRDTFFTLQAGESLSVVFDPETIDNITGGGLTSWQWYKFDKTRGGKLADPDTDPYKWTGIADGGEVDVWFISTESQLTIGKEIEDLFPGENNDPADAAANEAEFQFDLTFTLQNDPATSGDELTYFGEAGGSYSVKYTIDGGPEQTMALTKGVGDNTYTSTDPLTLKKGQKATFTLPAGTKYTVTEQSYTAVNGGLGFKPSKITITNDGDVPSTNFNEGTASGEVALPGAVVGDGGISVNGTLVTFTNAPSGVALVKTQAGGDNDSDGTMHIGSGETVTYTITVYNYDVPANELTVTDVIPPAAAVSGAGADLPKLRVHETTVNGDGITYVGEEGATGQASGNAYGGTVTWTDTAVPGPEGSKDITFQVSVPIVRQALRYTNKATATWNDGVEHTANSNEVTMTAYEDWLRIGKVAYDDAGQPITFDQEFEFTLTLILPADHGDAAIDGTYDYVGRTALGYEGMGVAAPARGTLTMTGTDENTKTSQIFTLKTGQAITIYGIDAGIQYQVEETPVKGYKSSGMLPRNSETPIVDGVGTISASADDWVYFINRSSLGTLEVTKTVQNGPADYANDEFTFDVSFTLPAEGADSNYFGTDPYAVGYTVTGPGAAPGELTLGLRGDTTTYTGELKLKDGQTATFLLPEGTEYTIEEVIPAEDAKYYNLSKTGDDGTIVAAGQTYRAAFVNVGLGSLTITKTVKGDQGETDRAWDFTVALTGVNADYEATVTKTAAETAEGGEDDDDAGGDADATITFKGGVGSFTLKHGESLTIEGLPAVAYTVTEADANKDGYTTTVSPGARGTIPAEGTAEVSFVNDRTTNKGGSSADGSGTGSGSPRTGDETGLALWAALASGSMLALAAVLTLYRKRDRS